MRDKREWLKTTLQQKLEEYLSAKGKKQNIFHRRTHKKKNYPREWYRQTVSNGILINTLSSYFMFLRYLSMIKKNSQWNFEGLNVFSL